MGSHDSILLIGSDPRRLNALMFWRLASGVGAPLPQNRIFPNIAALPQLSANLYQALAISPIAKADDMRALNKAPFI